jgi:preprotein translocase subunit SecF
MHGLVVGQVILQLMDYLGDPQIATILSFNETRYNFEVYVFAPHRISEKWLATACGMNIFIEECAEGYSFYTRSLSGMGGTMRYFFDFDLSGVPRLISTGGKIPLTAVNSEGERFRIVSHVDFDVREFEFEYYELVGIDNIWTHNLTASSYMLHSGAGFRDFDLLSIPIMSGNGGGRVPLVQLLDPVSFDNYGNIAKEEGANSIRSINGRRSRSITVLLADGATENRVRADIERALAADFEFPEGMEFEYSSLSNLLNETVSALFFVLALAVVFMYLIFVAQFQSLKAPLVIMLTIPLAFTGSILMLLAFGMNLSIVALVALIILIGIITNNGIVYVDYCNKLIDAGFTARDAVLKAGRDRIRPILMTALTTIFALTIMAFNTSPEAEMMRPMGVATLGGLLYATLMTLFVVPVFYSIFNKKRKKSFFARNKELDSEIDKIAKEDVIISDK